MELSIIKLNLKGQILEKILRLKDQKTLKACHQADDHYQIQACAGHGWYQCRIFYQGTISQ